MSQETIRRIDQPSSTLHHTSQSDANYRRLKSTSDATLLRTPSTDSTYRRTATSNDTLRRTS